jgi:U3 small nucleolar RNA-associated protein 21
MWSAANHAISKVSVEQSSSLQAQRVTSVAVSLCGNFGALGYSNGLIQKFNVQSGTDRGLFTGKEDSELTIHLKEVTGLGIDSLNHHLVSASLDSSIKLWDFFT